MYEKFEKLLNERNVTPYRVHKETKISTATLSDWKNGKSQPKKDKIEKLCEYFNVPLSYFYGNEESKEEDTVRPEPELSNVYFSLAKEAEKNGIDPRDIKMAIEMLKKIREEEKNR